MQKWFKHALCDAAVRVHANYETAEVLVSGKHVLIIADMKRSKTKRVIMHAQMGDRFTIVETKKRDSQKLVSHTFPEKSWKKNEKLTELTRDFYKHHAQTASNKPSYCMPPHPEPSWWKGFSKNFDEALGIYPQGHNSHIFED